MPRIINKEDVEALAIGGIILGGGGGGWSETGRSEGKLALEIGKIELHSSQEADPNWKVITSAALGAPTQVGNTRPMHFIRAAQVLRNVGVEFDGVIAAENGGHNSFGGWIIAASLGFPIVDAPCDGRAHPTAMMGSMGLQRLEYKSVKSGVTEGCEVVAWGSLQTTSNVIRAQARDMKSLIAMARDPVPVSYSIKHGASGAISMAINLGYEYLDKKNCTPDEKVESVLDFLDGDLICKSEIISKTIEAQGGFDVGYLTLMKGSDEWELTFVNEYMTLEKNDKRLSTFPDLLTTFNNDGEPVTSASLNKGDTIYLAAVPKEKIPVGDGNKYSENYISIEAVIGKPMIKHLKGYLID
jgi:hypothetical protein